MREQGEGFFHFAKRKSLQHRDYFNGFVPDTQRYQMLLRESEASLNRQQEMEQQDSGGFAQFLADYFAQR
jgi:glutamate--cysteine ligase